MCVLFDEHHNMCVIPYYIIHYRSFIFSHILHNDVQDNMLVGINKKMNSIYHIMYFKHLY